LAAARLVNKSVASFWAGIANEQERKKQGIERDTESIYAPIVERRSMISVKKIMRMAIKKRKYFAQRK
jgi:hypothetical protein